MGEPYRSGQANTIIPWNMCSTLKNRKEKKIENSTI